METMGQDNEPQKTGNTGQSEAIKEKQDVASEPKNKIQTAIDAVKNATKKNAESGTESLTSPDIIDETEAKTILDALGNVSAKDILLYEENNTVVYQDAMRAIQSSLDAWLAKQASDNSDTSETSDSSTADAIKKNPDTSSIQELRDRLAAKNTLGAKINAFTQGTEINALLAAEGLTLGGVIDNTSKALTQQMNTLLTTELLKSDMFTKGAEKKGTLNVFGEKMKESLMKEITPERANNISFALFEEIIGSFKTKIGKAQGNKEVMITEKVALLTNMKNIMKNGGLQDINALSKNLASIDPLWETLRNFQQNFSLLLHHQLKEAGVDMTSKDTLLATLFADTTGKEKRNKELRAEVIETRLPAAFGKALSFFDSYGNSKNMLQAMLHATKEKPFDPTAIPEKTNKEENISATEIGNLVKNMNEIAKDMPLNPKSPEAQQLKQMMVMNKVDALWDKLPMKDIAFSVLTFLEKIGLKDIFIKLFGKAFGLNEKELGSVFERPYIKSGLDLYKQGRTVKQDAWMLAWKEGQSLSEEGSTKDFEGMLPAPKTVRNLKQDYFRLSNDFVYKKTEEGAWVMQKLDAKGNVIPLETTAADGATVSDTEQTVDETTRDFFLGKEKTEGVALEQVIARDIDTISLRNAMALTIKTKTTKKFSAELGAGDSVYVAEVNKILGVHAEGDTPPDTAADTTIQTMIQAIMTQNKYIYSTDQLITALLEKTLVLYGQQQARDAEIAAQAAEKQAADAKKQAELDAAAKAADTTAKEKVANATAATADNKTQEEKDKAAAEAKKKADAKAQTHA